MGNPGATQRIGPVLRTHWTHTFIKVIFYYFLPGGIRVSTIVQTVICFCGTSPGSFLGIVYVDPEHDDPQSKIHQSSKMARTKKTSSMSPISGSRRRMAQRSCMRLVDVKKLLRPRRRTIPRKGPGPRRVVQSRPRIPDISLSSQLATILGIISGPRPIQEGTLDLSIG